MKTLQIFPSRIMIECKENYLGQPKECTVLSINTNGVLGLTFDNVTVDKIKNYKAIYNEMIEFAKQIEVNKTLL